MSEQDHAVEDILDGIEEAARSEGSVAQGAPRPQGRSPNQG